MVFPVGVLYTITSMISLRVVNGFRAGTPQQDVGLGTIRYLSEILNWATSLATGLRSVDGFLLSDVYTNFTEGLAFEDYRNCQQLVSSQRSAKLGRRTHSKLSPASRYRRHPPSEQCSP